MPEALSSVMHSLRGAGWLLVVLLVLGIAIYHTIFHLTLYLKRCSQVPIGTQFTILDTANPSEVGRHMQEARLEYLEIIDRRLPFLYVLISAAPLTGLLGTVAGMLTTFHGLGIASSRTPIDLISQGISQALITTQAGLIIAIPGYMAAAALKKRRDDLDRTWARAESTLCQAALKRKEVQA